MLGFTEYLTEKFDVKWREWDRFGAEGIAQTPVGPYYIKIDAKTGGEYQLSFTDAKGSYMTGSTKMGKSAIHLIKTVEDAAIRFAKEFEPKIISFAAKATEASKVRLYDRMHARVAKAIGWKPSTAMSPDNKFYFLDNPDYDPMRKYGKSAPKPEKKKGILGRMFS